MLRKFFIYVVALSASVWAQEMSASRKPNVLFIITDDQYAGHFKYLSGSDLMPNVNRLAKQGVRFTRAYATSSVCTPSRYSCLTGRYASRSRCERFLSSQPIEGQRWVHWNADVASNEWTVAKVLRDNGYATGLVGKLHGIDISVTNGLPAWVNGASDPDDPKVDQALRSQQKNTAERLKAYGFDYAASINHGNMPTRACLPKKLREHSPEWKVKSALEFIETNKDRPFYLYYAATLTHGPDPLQSLEADVKYTEGGTFDDLSGIQPSRANVLERGRSKGLKNGHDFGAMWLDDSIGVLLRKLETLGLKENTLIVFFNDHGCEGGKGSLYEGGIKTPCIISWPKEIQSRQIDSLVANIDFAPTIFSACGISKPDDYLVDGKDLMPLLTGKTDKVRDRLLCEIGYTRAIVSKDWKYLAFRIPPSRRKTPVQVKAAVNKRYSGTNSDVGMMKKINSLNPGYNVTHIHRFPGGDATELYNGVSFHAETYFDSEQLYNLASDSKERVNLVGNVEYTGKLREMKAELEKQVADLPGVFGEVKTK